MTKPSQPNSSDSRKKQIPKTQPLVAPKNISVLDNEHTSDGNGNAAQHQQIVTPDDKSNRNARIANVIAGIALVVSAILAWYTYKVFEIASSQKDSVKKSADASMLSAQTAQNTLNETKRYNDSYLKSETDAFNEAKRYNDGSLNIQQNAFDSNNKESKERFKRDTMALGLQIKALKQSNEQFVKQNEPYLKVEIDSVYVQYGQLKVRYYIINLSNTPVRVIGEKTEAQIAVTPPVKKGAFNDRLDGITYITKESPQQKIFTLRNITKEAIEMANDGTYSIYWNAVFEYVNEITDEKRLYTISVKINKTNGRNPPYQSFSDNTNKTR
ncbi:MAG: hypothetical protein ACXVAY_15145 [Mucilaginibacter sp.]